MPTTVMMDSSDEFRDFSGTMIKTIHHVNHEEEQDSLTYSEEEEESLTGSDSLENMNDLTRLEERLDVLEKSCFSLEHLLSDGFKSLKEERIRSLERELQQITEYKDMSEQIEKAMINVLQPFLVKGFQFILILLLTLTIVNIVSLTYMCNSWNYEQIELFQTHNNHECASFENNLILTEQINMVHADLTKVVEASRRVMKTEFEKMKTEAVHEVRKVVEAHIEKLQKKNDEFMSQISAVNNEFTQSIDTSKQETIKDMEKIRSEVFMLKTDLTKALEASRREIGVDFDKIETKTVQEVRKAAETHINNTPKSIEKVQKDDDKIMSETSAVNIELTQSTEVAKKETNKEIEKVRSEDVKQSTIIVKHVKAESHPMGKRHKREEIQKKRVAVNTELARKIEDDIQETNEEIKNKESKETIEQGMKLNTEKVKMIEEVKNKKYPKKLLTHESHSNDITEKQWAFITGIVGFLQATTREYYYMEAYSFCSLGFVMFVIGCAVFVIGGAVYICEGDDAFLKTALSIILLSFLAWCFGCILSFSVSLI